MKLVEYIVLLSVLTVFALWSVREEQQTLNIGYQLSQLSAQRDALTRERAELLYQRSLLARPDRLEMLAQQYGLELVAPGIKSSTRPVVLPNDRDDAGRLRLVDRSEGGR